MHGQVIGTDISVFFGEEGTEGPISAGRQLGDSFGMNPVASRYEAPDAVIFCRATRLLEFFGISVSKAGRGRGHPKKGRGTAGGFDRGLRPWNGPNGWKD